MLQRAQRLVLLPALLPFLLPREVEAMAGTCACWKAIVESSQWTVGGLPCITDSRRLSAPTNFIFHNKICIKKRSEENERFFDFDDLIYETFYMENCCIMSTSYGWGMFALKTIPASTPIITYTGELISNEERDKRLIDYDKKALNYILSVKEHSLSPAKKRKRSVDEEDDFTLCSNIDATHMGGPARFINHSCEPNLTLEMKRVNNSNYGVVASPVLRTVRVVAPHEQLCFDYSESDPDYPQNIEKKDFDNRSEVSLRNQCRCGSSRCRLWLPDIFST